MNIKRTLLQGALIVATAATLAACQGSSDGDDAKTTGSQTPANSTEQQSMNNGSGTPSASPSASKSSIPAAPASSNSGSGTGGSGTTGSDSSSN